ncbi:MAG: ABC transporter substrate-binding protein [Alphaproteobacteria bacterium]|nr:ABC transporter substrate-binding protein [Alphaproteobacteria bacterium]
MTGWGHRVRPLALATATLALGALGAAAQTLTIGLRGGPESLDPHFSALGTHAEAMKHIYDTLVFADAKNQVQPWLAESWKAVDDTTWEFKLRKGVKFHDGSEMTAADVKFSIERVPAVAGPVTTTIYVKNVAAIEIVDPHTIRFKTKEPVATLPYDFVRVFVVSAKAAAAATTKEASPQEFNSGKAAIGTGPFRYVSWTPKGDLVLDRFEGYWQGPAPWQRVVRKEMSSDPARVAALRAGQVDVINYVPSADYETLQRDSRLTVAKADSVYVFNLQLDQRERTPRVYDLDGKVAEPNPLRDARVREAIDLAIDRRTLVDIVLEGFGKPANQLMPDGFFGSSARIPAKPFDVERAKKLLADAGYGKGFRIDLHCTNDRLPGDGVVCGALGQMLAKIGVVTNVQAISRTVFFPAQAKLEYSVFMNGWGTLTGEASYTLGSMAHTPAPDVGMGQFNRIAYSNKEVDRLLELGRATLDDGKRRAAYEEAMEKIVADRAYLSLVVLQTAWGGQAAKVVLAPRADEDTLAYFIKPKR